MVSIPRRKIFTKKVENSLKNILDIKFIEFEDSVNVMKFLDVISKAVDCVKTPMYIQVEKYGGKIIPGATKPPYYVFESSEKKVEFENTFCAYVDGSEDFETLNKIDVQIYQSVLDGLPDDTADNVIELINFVIV